YYRGLAGLQTENLEAAKGYLESAVAIAQGVYLTRSILAHGAVAGHQGEYDQEQGYYADALKYKQDYFSYIETMRALAIYGQQRDPITILERLYRIANKAPGQRLKLDVLNSLAVELHNAGRREEAARLSSAVCSSPLVVVYPEWRATKEEIAQDQGER